jgi:predicted DNA binding CopG/RHH family protein
MRRRPNILPLPHFHSEEEDLRFWDEHHPADYFTVPAPDVVVKLKRSRKRMVSVRIDEGLQADLKDLAAKHDVPYQKLMRELLRWGVEELKGREVVSPRSRTRKPVAS